MYNGVCTVKAVKGEINRSHLSGNVNTGEIKYKNYSKTKSLLKTSLFCVHQDLLPLFIYCHLPAADLLPDSAMGNSEVILITDISFLHHSQQCQEWQCYLLRPAAVNCRSHTHTIYASWVTKAKRSLESSSSPSRQK